MDGLNFEVGTPIVKAEINRGHHPEFWAEGAANKIVGIGQNAHPAIREQAEAFKAEVKAEVYKYMMLALRSDRQTMAGEIRTSGYHELADQILRFNIKRNV